MSAPAPITLEGLSSFPLPALGASTDKERRGRLLVVGGGSLAPGAVLLTGMAALRVGAGKLQIACARRNAPALAFAAPEAAVLCAPCTREGDFKSKAAAVLADRVAEADALVIGPGLSRPDRAGRLAVDLLEHLPVRAGCVVDAAAMTGLDIAAASVRSTAGRLVLTPHAGEMAKLVGQDRGDVEADPLSCARRLAGDAGAVVVMKGGDSYIVTPDGRAWLHQGGVVGLATSGSGDVLAGLIGGLLARGASPLTATLWGVCLHGAAGARLCARVGPLGFLARELPTEVPALLMAAGGAG